MGFINAVIFIWCIYSRTVEGTFSWAPSTAYPSTDDVSYTSLDSNNSFYDLPDNNVTYFNSTNSTYYSEPRIINGQFVLVQLFPYQVSLEYRGSFTCGGSIISSKWVLTAGHCVGRRPAKDFDIRAGSEFRGIGGVVHKVDRIVRHPLYLIYFFYDFALMEVRMPFLMITPGVQAIRLASKLPRAGTKATVSGFGKTRYLFGKPAKALKAVDLKIVNHFVCNLFYYGIMVDWTHFCANAIFRGPCNGDSGGPLVVSTWKGPEQIGVVSWGRRCSTLGSPSVYGNVARVRPWIKHVTGV